MQRQNESRQGSREPLLGGIGRHKNCQNKTRNSVWLHGNRPLFCSDLKIVLGNGGQIHFSTTPAIETIISNSSIHMSHFQLPTACHPLLSLSKFICHRVHYFIRERRRWKTAFKEFFDCEALIAKVKKRLDLIISSSRILKENCGPRCVRLWSPIGVVFCQKKEMRKITMYFIERKTLFITKFCHKMIKAVLWHSEVVKIFICVLFYLCKYFLEWSTL